MSTNAEIIIHHDGIFTSIGVHWDGYPEYVGRLLREHYSQVEDDARLSLLALGDLSSLNETANTSIAYHRDRNEPWHLCAPYTHKATSISELVEDKKLGDVDYGYIWSEGKWYIYTFEDAKNYQELTEKIVKEGLE